MTKRATLSLPGSKAHYSSTNIDANFNAVNNNFDNYLHLGGTGESSNSMSGDLDMNSNSIANVAAPSLSHHVATKAYVDATLTVVSTGTTVGSLLDDADNDTGVNAEATADLDRLDLFAGTSGGADTALQVIGDDSAVSALTNPYIKALKHIVLDTGVRIGDATSADTYIELNRSGTADTIFLVAGGTTIMTIDANVLVGGNIEMSDAAATAAGKKIGDQDGDTYIQFNQATGGTDDDTFRVICGSTEVLTLTATTLTLGISTMQLDGLNLGIAAPGASEDNNIIMTTGTANTGANMSDNTIALYSTVVSGIENDLRIDVKTGASSKETIILGSDCTLPGNLTVTGNLTVSGDITPASSSWPSFAAKRTIAQSIPYSTVTKLQINTEVFDTNSDYDSGTNYRFTPTVAGKYLLACGAVLSSTPAHDYADFRVSIHKNGTAYKSARQLIDPGAAPSAGYIAISLTAIVDANGTTDYFEVFAFQGNSASAAVSTQGTGEGSTYFDGCRIA